MYALIFIEWEPHARDTKVNNTKSRPSQRLYTKKKRQEANKYISCQILQSVMGR